jgi:dienelactone hydrolase
MKAFLLFGIALCAAAQIIEVVPDRVMFDESAAIRVKGLAPGARVALRAELTDGGGNQWASQAEFTADESGTVSVQSTNLIWPMMPVSKKVSAYQASRELAPQVIEFHLLKNKQKLATARIEQVILGDGVRHVAVHDDGLRGIFFTPAGAGRHPGVLVVSGSNGGVPVRQAVWLASHGYAAFALGYFRYEDLPPQLEDIPLEYFQHALAWMSKRPEIEPEHLAVMGTSRGGELALQLGSMFPAVTAVVAYVPADVRYASCCRMTGGPAWTWQGRALPYLVPRFGRTPETVARAAIEVERTRGPILMISGEDDHLWHSWEMADNVVSRLKRAHFAYNFENLKYAHAGHSAGRPGIQPAWHGAVRNPTSGRENDLGGSAKGDAESTIDSMPKVLEFLRRATIQ